MKFQNLDCLHSSTPESLDWSYSTAQQVMEGLARTKRRNKHRRNYGAAKRREMKWKESISIEVDSNWNNYSLVNTFFVHLFIQFLIHTTDIHFCQSNWITESHEARRKVVALRGRWAHSRIWSYNCYVDAFPPRSPSLLSLYLFISLFLYTLIITDIHSALVLYSPSLFL